MDDKEEIFGIVAITAFKDDTYKIETSLSYEETYQLVLDALRDLEDGTLSGIEDFSHGEIKSKFGQ